MTTEEKILKAAAELFHERGFAAVRLDDIGARVGVTGPAIYRHFESKDALLVALFEQAFDRFFEHLGPPLEDPLAEFEGMIRRHTRLVLDQLEWSSVAVRESRSLSGESRRRLARREHHYMSRWIDVIGRFQPELEEAEQQAVAYGIVGLLNSVVHWPRAARELDDAVELVARMALDSLRSVGPQVTPS